MKKNTTHLCWTPLCANNVSNTWALLQTEVKKNRTTFLCGNRNGHGAQNVKTHNSATHNSATHNFLNKLIAVDLFEELLCEVN